jgi:hypothetical protein
MGITKALTNDLERALRLYRIPILTALALSLRRNPTDRFLLTDDRAEDSRRNVVRMRRISTVEQNTTKPGIGVDDRQFTALTGNLMFTGLPDANGVVQPIYNLTNMGGQTDIDGVVFTATGTTEEKQAKARRYNRLRPGDVSWRVRTPVMMADETSIIDYLAFRCTQLKYLHSITFKWSDRRWDARTVGLDQDLFRPDGERTQMVILAPMWMDESMSILNPAVWGPFESLIQANYEEALGRKIDEQMADCAAFVATFNEYLQVLAPSTDTPSSSVHGRVSRFLDTTANRSLHLPFNRQIISQDGNDSYRVTAVDPDTALNVTQDVFNLLDAQNQWRLTSSFEAATLADDGWCGTATTAPSTDIPTDLPAYAQDRAGNPVYGTKSLQVTQGYVCRRMVLPNGSYALRLWIKTDSKDARVEVVKNNRLLSKGWTMSQVPPRVTSIKHWRENYETVAASTMLEAAGWREFFISFNLLDNLQIAGEGYPAHEVYIVITATDVIHVDHLDLFQDKYGHEVAILNTVNLSAQPFDVRPELRHVNLEKAFQADSVFGVREVAASSFRLDGAETVVSVAHRDAYNIKPEGTTIDTWFKVNSDDEQANNVLTNRGSFTLFQKTGAYLPGYAVVVNRERLMIGAIGNSQAFSSKQFRNTMLHPSVGNSVFPPRTDWANPNIYDTFKTAYRETGLQPMEWISPPVGIAVVGMSTDIGGGKFLLVAVNDPYLPAHGSPSSVPIADYLEWHARQAYGQIMPVDQVNPAGTVGGFVFAPVPVNSMLNTIGAIYGDYSIPPGDYSPRFLYSPLVSPYPTSPLDHPSSSIFSPLVSPSPNQQDIYPVYWPIPPGDWGDVPVQWPADTFVYGSPLTWNPFVWSSIYDEPSMKIRHPMFVGGKLRFDRWCHFNMAVATNDLEVGIHGITVYLNPSFTFNPATASNGDDLLIGTTTIKALKVAAPISLYSFKIFQYRMPSTARSSIFSGEATNFNELQYNVYKEDLDYNLDQALDFWQDDITDLGLWTHWPNVSPDPYKPFPPIISNQYGQVVASVADPLTIASDVDRNRNLLTDWYDASYLQELIDTQTIGFADGLILWDFIHPDQAETYDYHDRYYDATCKTYRPRTLSYLDWIQGVLAEEWNQVTAIHDPMPGFQQAGSPSPWPSPAASPNPAGPWPSFGDKPNELVMTGVKGRFGWEGLLGYRDSLAQVAREGIVFNYLQVEYHFRAPRTELEALLRPYAHGIDQIFEDDYVGNHLTKQTPS